jgi:nitrate/nitrite-specific signal transduction histidine kinase
VIKNRTHRTKQRVQLAQKSVKDQGGRQSLKGLESLAEQTMLHVNFADREIKLVISDDGIGFQAPNSPTDFALSGHFGLLGIRERADLIGARPEVESALGKGTRLRIVLSEVEA